jgi:hypothetical protein
MLTFSKRFKEEIKPMEQASDALFALKPLTFRYKKAIDPAGKSQFGLVAKEVEKVNPDLIVQNKEGKAVQRSLRPGERDAAQRVSERASCLCRRASPSAATTKRD